MTNRPKHKTEAILQQTFNKDLKNGPHQKKERKKEKNLKKVNGLMLKFCL